MHTHDEHTHEHQHGHGEPHDHHHHHDTTAKRPQAPAFDFADFLRFFPEIELPVTLSAESHHHFSERNEPFPRGMAEQFLQPLFPEQEDDEFTEWIPCLALPETFDFHALVAWRASLLQYSFWLLSFDKKGQLIDKAQIAGTQVLGQEVEQSVATIDEEWLIYLVKGRYDAQGQYFDAASSQASNMELLTSGKVRTI